MAQGNEAKRGLLRRLYDWVLGWADTRFGTPALAGVSFVESSFFPVPPDPLLLALAVGKPRRGPYYSLVCTAASVAGGLLGYWIGAAAMETIGRGILDFYHLEEQFAKLRESFLEYGFLAVLGAALTPIPYKVFTISAGACGMSLATFTAASLIGRGLRFLAEGFLIYFFGAPIKSFIDRYFDVLSVLFLVLLVGGFILIALLT